MTLLRTALLTIIAITVALAVLIAAPRPAHGCMCDIDYPLSDYIEDAAVIFTGRPVQRIEPNDPSYHISLSRSEGITLIFEVDQVFKGQAGPLLAARTGYGGGDCGFPLFDTAYTNTIVVFATLRGEQGWWASEPGDLEVGLCDYFHTVNETTEALGPGYPPDETMVQVRKLLENPDKAPAGLYWLIGTIAAALVGGTVLAYRLRAGNPARRGAASADHRTTGKQ